MSNAEVKREEVEREEGAAERTIHLSRFHVSRFQDLAIFVILLLGTFALYARTAHFGFVNYDDGDYVYDNPWMRQGISSDGISWAFTTAAASNWHPLTWLSLMLDVSLFGANPGAMHLVNAGMHALNAGLLFLTLVRITGARWPSAWVAAMFAVHPLHVESVAWISERKDVLSTLLWMLCTLAYVAYVRKPTVGRYALVLVLLALGLMAKPMLVTLPFVFLLLDYWPLSRVSNERREEASETETGRPDRTRLPLRGSLRASLRRIILEKLPMLALVFASAIATYVAQSAGRSVAAGTRFPLTVRLENTILSYGKYLWMTFDARHLAIIYPHFANLPKRPPTFAAQIAASAALLIVVTALAILLRRRHPWLFVGWFWYLGTLVPVIGLVQVGSQGLADRYTYVPLVGIFIAVAWMTRDAVRRARALGSTAMVLAILMVAGSAVLTWRQLGYWRDGVTVMRHAIDVVPDNYLAHTALGEALDAAHDAPGAAEEYRRALAIRPDDPIAHNNLGVQAALAGRVDEAKTEYEAAIRADPQYGGTYYNLGKLLEKQGDLGRARALYQRAADLGFPRGDDALATLLAAEGKLEQAMALWQDALRRDPSFADAHHGLGVAMLMRGDNRQGIDHLRAALAIEPNRIDTLSMLAWTLATHPNPAYQDGAEAERLARRAIELSKSPDPRLLDTLAAALARNGKFDGAANTAEQAADLAQRQGANDFAGAIRNRLQLYRSHRPYTSGR